ncbi:uncharacterized protein LOC129589355 [Paramacrobiotus metropolitanus]|uniref:uncharacterized protein LOC129589355 n=1 Tax=Paramacrobiotus metropolitanus TaxID=2943436 RepID=UPI0024462BF1|nr:uncharacterized protein LOC129589355 [Paramacrobiotus metropolitanus]
MWKIKTVEIKLGLAFCLSLFVVTNSLGTFLGRQRVLARQRRAAQTKWSPQVYSPPAGAAAQNYASSQSTNSASARNYLPTNANAQQTAQAPYIPQVPFNQQQYPSYSQYPTATQSQYAAAYPANQAAYAQYATPKNSAYSTAGQTSAYNAGQAATYNNPYANYNAAAMSQNPTNTYQTVPQQQLTNTGYGNSYNLPASGQQANYYPAGNNMQNMNGYNAGYNQQAAANMFNAANINANKYKNPNVNSAYPSVQSSFAKNQYAQPGSPEYARQNFALYQDPLRTPMQYNYKDNNNANGYNQYNNQRYQNNAYNGGGGYGQGRSGQSPPMVTPPPQQTAQQYELSEFCKKPDREPKCRKNAFGMCDYQDNYPSEVATEFFAYYKSRITAMTTDFDYSNSDQYDTGFATQQNKLIDFVHDIFSDNEYGNLPGVPPEKKGLCVGVSDTIQPGWARTAHGKYYVIMNSNNVKQTIRAEVCKNVGKGCQTVPKCYKSECRQRYRFDTLLVFDPCDAKRAPMLELFKIPDGCECFVIVEEPDLIPADLPTQPTSSTFKHQNLTPTGDFSSSSKTTEATAATSGLGTTTTVAHLPNNSTTASSVLTTKQTLILSPR